MPNSITDSTRYKRIPLSRGLFAIVDNDLFDYLNQWKWSAARNYGTVYYATRYARLNGKDTTVRMHRVIMNAPRGTQVDHINGNGLDNRRENLRFCTTKQNLRNRGKNSRNTSGYKGVSWAKHANKWNAQIVVNRKRINLGYYEDVKEAALAYDEAARKYHGEFCNTNF